MRNKKILIATGIYPPQPGGPSYYAKSLKDSLEKLGCEVVLAKFSKYLFLPPFIRHLFYLAELVLNSRKVDFILALNTFSVAFPAVIVGKMLGIPVIIRTGGDTVWEAYVERTGEKILLSEFYKKKRKLSLKESFQKKIIGWTLRGASIVVFSTTYQRDIFIPAYGLDIEDTAIIENCYPPSRKASPPHNKKFICIVRDLKWKNTDLLKEAFKIAKVKSPEIELEIDHNIPREEVFQKINSSYAVILPSLGDISPNFILEALMFGKPFILTSETGLKDRLRDVGIFADPLDTGDIADKINWLAKPENYQVQIQKINNFSFVHTYDDIAEEFLDLSKKL